ncbi:MAG: hypothetical protein GY929_28110, partial [Actinomycetia bacterium]|nr:hypothetical protein [Actinomycetes bacterium]
MIRKTIDTVNARTADDGGYILTMAGLILVPLVMVVGFAVDIGSWYLQAAETQRAADASALAAVVWLPDMSSATTEARATAAKNGYEHGVNATVTVTELDSRRIQVDITEDTDLYFTTLFLTPFDLTRGATAEFVRPVPLGSPRNILGSGDLLSPNPDNLWLAVNGFCASRESGDKLLAGYEATKVDGESHTCDPDDVDDNIYYDPEGYWFSVYFPEAILGPVHFDVYDASFIPGGGSIDIELKSDQDITTRFEVREADDTIFNRYDNDVIATVTAPSGDGSWRTPLWRTLHTVHNPAAGSTYYIRVWTDAMEPDSRGSNQFSLRVREGSSFSVCSALTDSGCPQMSAVDYLSVFAKDSSSTADFFLAEIDGLHAGKTLVVELFDPGEGASTIQLLAPDGSPVTFDWTTPCSPPVPPSGGCSGTTNSLDVSSCSNQAQPGPNRSSKCKYNDRVITLEYELPANYDTLYPSNKWWK